VFTQETRNRLPGKIKRENALRAQSEKSERDIAVGESEVAEKTAVELLTRMCGSTDGARSLKAISEGGCASFEQPKSSEDKVFNRSHDK